MRSIRVRVRSTNLANYGSHSSKTGLRPLTLAQGRRPSPASAVEGFAPYPSTPFRFAFSASHHHVPGAPVEYFGVTAGRSKASQ